MAPPSSQKPADCPVGFVLDDTIVYPGSSLQFHGLYIRPEDLTRSEPSRISVEQTLGGTFLDDFGAGLRSLQIAGHTGWLQDSKKKDGLDRMLDLRETVFAQYHDSRQAARDKGLDPAKVDLIFVDYLNHYVYSVAPQNFVLKRSKSRPLLAMYQITLAVMHEIDDIRFVQSLLPQDPAKPDFGAAMASLADVVAKIQVWATDIQNFVSNTLGAPVKQFLALTAKILTLVQGVKSAVDGVAKSLIQVATDLTQAGSNLFRAAAGLANLPGQIKARLMEVAGAFSAAFCAMSNIFSTNLLLLPDYAPLYGSSSCSSTIGGAPLSPLRNTNGLAGVASTDSPQQASAGAAISAMKNLDPTNPPSDGTMAANLSAINATVKP